MTKAVEKLTDGMKKLRLKFDRIKYRTTKIKCKYCNKDSFQHNIRRHERSGKCRFIQRVFFKI